MSWMRSWAADPAVRGRCRGRVPPILIADALVGRDPQIAIVEQLRARRVDKLILVSFRRSDPVHAHCLEIGTPVVLVNRRPRSPRCVWCSAPIRRWWRAARFAGALARFVGHNDCRWSRWSIRR